MCAGIQSVICFHDEEVGLAFRVRHGHSDDSCEYLGRGPTVGGGV